MEGRYRNISFSIAQVNVILNACLEWYRSTEVGVPARFLEVKIRINFQEETKVPRIKNDLDRGKMNKNKEAWNHMGL